MAVQTTNFPAVRTVTQLVRAMLGDDAVAPGYPFNPVSVVAAGGVVTATFAIPPGFISNDQLLIAGFAPGAHDGTFPCGQLSGNQISWQNNAAPNGAAGTIGTVQGYGTGKKYTDPVLMAFVNSAYRALQRALRGIGSTEFRQNQAFLTVPGLSAGDPSTTVEIGYGGMTIESDANPAPGFVTVPAFVLPSDLLTPRKLMEAPTGSGDRFVEMADLTNEGGLPSRAQGMALGCWEWAGDAIALIGALQSVDLRMEYDRSLPPVATGADQLMVLNSEDYHANAVCALLEPGRGGKNTATYMQQADEAKEKLIGAAVRPQQFKSFRSRGFSSRRGYANPGRVL